jgi:hypothetical protein
MNVTVSVIFGLWFPQSQSTIIAPRRSLSDEEEVEHG